MKRIFGAILILIIVALFISVHAYQPLNNVLSSGIEVIRKFVVNSYDKFATFCYDAIGKLSSNHFGLSIENWALVGYIIVLVLFLIVYFILFGIIAHIRNKRIINKKKAEGDSDYEVDKFPTKRLIFAFLIIASSGYLFFVLSNQQVHDAYIAFTISVRKYCLITYNAISNTAYKIANYIFKNNASKLSQSIWTVIFSSVVMVLFYVLYFVIFGLIAKAQKNKKKKTEENFTKTRSNIQEINNAESISKAKQFNWQDYIGGRPIKRVIFGIVLSIILLAFLALRFFDYFNTSDSYSIVSLAPVFDFFSPLFSTMDIVENSIFGGFKNNIISNNLINNQPFNLMQLFDFVFWIVVSIVLVVMQILICTIFAHMFRKKYAIKRAKKAELKYLNELNSLPKEERFYASSKSGEQLGIPTSKVEGADVETIAKISNKKLTGAMSDEVSSADYIDDISEGVRYIGIAQPQEDDSITIHETREPLVEEPMPGEEDVLDVDNNTADISELNTIDDDSETSTEHIVNLFQPDIYVNVENCDISTIRTVEEQNNSVDTNDISDVILFDNDGFAYFESAGPRSRNFEDNNKEITDEIPETYDYVEDRNFDSGRLVEDLVTSNVIVEPSFGRVENNDKKENEKDEVPEYLRKLDYKIKENDDDLRMIESIEPSKIIPVNDWPDEESSEIEDAGCIHIILDSFDESIKYENKNVEIAPIIEQVLDEKVVNEKQVKEPVKVIPKMAGNVKPMAAPIRPIRPINNVPRNTIKPIAIKPKKENTQEEIAYEDKPQMFINKPLHEINDRRKDIAPITVDTKKKFDLKKFSFGTKYDGNLSSQEAFEKGISTVDVVVSPVTISNDVNDKTPEWIKKRHAESNKENRYRNIKEIGIDESKGLKKPVEKVEKFTLRKSHKKYEENVESLKLVQPNTSFKKPIEPIKISKVEPENRTQVNEDIKATEVKKVALTKHTSNTSISKPIKPIMPVKKPKH